ncbi:CHAP domain-containing protein [Amycolatopsis sp. BJA-103]|uniref:CHAP domain-containing protein n=1 Tax=Amycolatopsis sp. BJA-103 TaxID=1911175 RepID=UPI000C779351|nr:CHAP domain-containing protein [Amycolatopsis sp. BJA-103]AUI59474.1 CHAP domain-containing protein [Amycolatopsis sp. BJA-103]PNE17084.1 CHAP domain-containing protein [Amycolatopsis sp. BJA-103]
MDTLATARHFAADILAHRNKLAGKAEDAARVQFALHQVSKTLHDQHDLHKKETDVVLSHWDGKASEEFERTTMRLRKDIRTTADASTDAERVVARVMSTVDGGHTAVQRLADEYIGKAKKLLDDAAGVGSRAAMVTAIAAAADLAPRYTKQSAATLRKVDGELTDAAKRLRALRKELRHDGVADRAVADHSSGHGKTEAAKASTRGQKVVSAARKELGTRENPPGSNRNPYGPTAPWCASFATAMWRKAGVKIPILPFTGDVYRWGQRHDKAYGKNSLKQAKPGDVLLFGTGPQSPSTSTHIGIVEKVEGDKVTMIEGNSGDSVRRNTHTLSSATFYGGVRP